MKQQSRIANTDRSKPPIAVASPMQDMARIHYRVMAGPSTRLSSDHIISEQPLQIGLRFFDAGSRAYQSKVLTVTMRTPGDDVELALGLLFAEGIIRTIEDVITIEQHSDDDSDSQCNQLELTLAPEVAIDWPSLQRDHVSYSSCGICGKASLKSLALKAPGAIDETPAWLSARHIVQMPDLLRARQELFADTGGVHGAGIFADDKLIACKEDIGRHNALDKVIGLMQREQLWQAKSVLVLSGRISFELVQKAVMAQIPVLVAVGAPSTLAIMAAKQFNLTLIGFTKPDSFNVYHGDWRLC